MNHTTTPVLPVNNSIYLRRRHKVVVPSVAGDLLLPLNYATTLAQNIEALGYQVSPPLMEACAALSTEQVAPFYNALVTDLKRLRGAHQTFAPMYPNFPTQVMEMSEAQLYFNARVHYVTGGQLLPKTDAKMRPKLTEQTELTRLYLGSVEEFTGLFGQIASSNTSLSAQDKEDIAWFVNAYGDSIGALLPATIPQKENMAFIAGQILRAGNITQASAFVGRYLKTATDALRLAVALSDGDVSLAQPAKFRTFSRRERVSLLALLERVSNPVEDMLRWKERWVRLGEKLHPGEYRTRFPESANAFGVLRNDEPFATFNGQIEQMLAQQKVAGALARLSSRPGDLARRLDHLLRLDSSSLSQEQVIATFAGVADRVSTPVLLQVRHHFAHRHHRFGLRVFFPKGNLAKAQGIENTLPDLEMSIADQVVAVCEDALRARFGRCPTLGKVYLDPALTDYMVPFALRSSSKSLRTLVRGSRLPLPPCSVLRFFVWWKDGKERTDIDLSATVFDEAFHYVDILSYYNLKSFGGTHSGDIVSAPKGASEFIDVNLKQMWKKNVRYIVMTLNSYTQQPYVELPECFAGWMARKEASSGEVFEPRTVQDRLDITADTKIAVPLVIDIVENRVIWCDMSLTMFPNFYNNVHSNMKGVSLTLRSLVEMKRPNLYDLFDLHAQARGQRVATAEEADTVFSVASGTPFRLEEIASQYMA